MKEITHGDTTPMDGVIDANYLQEIY